MNFQKWKLKGKKKKHLPLKQKIKIVRNRLNQGGKGIKTKPVKHLQMRSSEKKK